MTTASIQAEGRELARDNRSWVQALMFVGYAARGFIYVIMGVLALQLAIGRRRGETDRAGALAEIGAKPFGKALLIAMAAGFAAYALWHLLCASLDLERENTAHRVFRTARFVIYSIFAWSTLQYALKAKQEDGDKQSRDVTARVMEWPAGRWLVGAVGLVFIGMAIYSARQAAGDRYKQDLKTWEIPGNGTALEAIARTGMYARMFVFGLLGVFFLRAAWTHDSAEAKGLDDTLRSVANASYGKYALAALAVGLIAFGIYSFVEARYRKVMSS